ncbi:hypothetical protein E8E12_008181 [Didymella heteroderae]|uniref:Uncharacterized protein n=1 Tax=Didymella heteroderae TaxID=1769908 RepID=A0A9P5C2I4_9PLEO|nr:hypothetical protein E8E12_008181 [Didymella heteroderae]
MVLKKAGSTGCAYGRNVYYAREGDLEAARRRDKQAEEDLRRMAEKEECERLRAERKSTDDRTSLVKDRVRKTSLAQS